MNRKQRRRQAKLAPAGMPATPGTPADRGSFGANEALALLGGVRRPLPAPAGATGRPSPSAPRAPQPAASPEQNLFDAVYARTFGVLRTRPSPKTLVALVRAAVSDGEKAWAARRNAVESRRSPGFACASGCTWCCHQMVAAEPPEVIAIARHVETRFSPEARAALVERLAATDAQTRGLGIVARARTKLPCPFLVEHQCSIYEVRPLRCRGVYSRDAEHCRWAMDNPDQYFGDQGRRQGPGPAPLEPVRIMQAVEAGLLEAARTAGLPWQTLELVAGVRTALEEPRSAERYLAREPVFAAAILPEDDDPAGPRAPGRPPAVAATLAKPEDSP